MKKDFHIELINAFNEPDQAQWDYLDNLRKETELSKAGFIAKLKEANNNIFQAWKSLEMNSKLRLPEVQNLGFPFNSFLYYPHLKDFSTQFQGHIYEQHLKDLENFIKLYELRILQKEFLKKAKKAQSSKEKKEPENNEEEIKNTFNSMPIEQVREHFRPLTYKKNKVLGGEIWMTEKDFDTFIKRSFEGKKLEKPNIKLGSRGKGAVVKLFHQFYSKAFNGDFEMRGKEKYLELLKDSFDTSIFENVIISNFKSDEKKSTYKWV